MALASTAGFLPGGVAHSKPSQRSWFLDPILRAEKVVAYALTEPDAGSDMQRVATKARRENGRWVLNGTKQFISNAEHADFVMVVAVTDPSAALRSRFTMFIVERENPGFRYVRSMRAMGWRGHSLGAFALDDCKVDDDHVLGEVNGGFAVAMGHINATRIHLSGRYLGMANELIEMAVDYSKQRVAFGSALAQHQSLQFMLADCDVEREAARLLMYAAALAADAGDLSGDPSARIAASRSKLYGSEMVGRVADRVLQIFGGAGYVADLPIERMYRDARAFRIGEGTSEMQRIQIARHLLGR
jgi:acyl-CoA dehydrogenase